MSERWIEYLPLSEIQRAERNPKRHDQALLEASLRRHGFVETPTIDERTGRLVAGHGRLDRLADERARDRPVPDGLKLREDGEWLVPVQRGWSSKDDADAAAYLITSNEATIAPGWDEPELVRELTDLAAIDGGLEGTGFDEAKLFALRRRQEVPEPVRLTDPDEAPPLAPVSVSQPGDLIQLGPHRLFVGDSRRPESFEVLMGSERADLVWTDPPYGVRYQGGTAERLTLQGDDLEGEELAELLRLSLTLALEASRPGAAWYVCCPSGPRGLMFGEVLAGLGVWRQSLVWVKDSLVLGHGDYHYRHERILTGDTPAEPGSEDDDYEEMAYGWRPGAPRRRTPTRAETSVWEVARPKASRLHPTMKPVELVARALTNSSAPGDLVLDPFGGSGSTLLAAHQLGRRCHLVETDPRYADVIARRYQDHTGIRPVLESGRPFELPPLSA